jgi:hypothetical protein
MTSRFATAKEHLVRSLDDIVPKLFGGKPKTVQHEGRWAVVNPHRGDANIGQMTIWRKGARRGAWRDYVSGDKGDAVDLVAFALKGMVTPDTRMAALEWIENEFGIRTMSAEAKADFERQRVARVETAAKVDAEETLSKRERARKFHFSCAPEIRDTPVEIYLRSRSIRLDQVPHLAPTLRYHPACEYWMGAQRDGEGKKIGHVPRFPAMVAMMITPAGKLGANHYTFLEPDGSRKLDTRARGYLDADGRPQSAKLMFPASQGMFIPLTYGPHGMPARDVAAAGKTDWWAFTEGIEDGLSAAIGDERLRVHAAGSLAHLMGIPDHPAARGYLVFEDNDWGKPQAQAQFVAALTRLKSFGKPVERLAMPASWGKDVNDALRMES